MTFDDTLALICDTLRENGAPKDLIDKTVRDLRKAHEEEKADRAATKPKKAKNQFTILVSDTEGRLKGMELIGWVVQLEEEASPAVAYDRIVEAAGAFNRTKRGQKAPLNTLGEAMETLRGKALKRENPAEKTVIKTRYPVVVQPVSNALAK